MESDMQGSHAAPGRAERIATRIGFLVAGVATGAWAPLIPFLQARLAIDDAVLGLLLLCGGTGSILTMPLAGYAASRLGCRAVVLAASAALCLGLATLSAVNSIPSAIPALLMFGAGIGALDCVINIQAIIVERAHGRPMMSGFHGLFSIGGFMGAGGIAGLLSLGLTPPPAAALIAALSLLSMLSMAQGLLPYGIASSGPAFARPHGPVLFIGILCFVMFLAEGAVADWSAVFLIAVRKVDPEVAGLGFTAFAATMTIGRLTGDQIVQALGPRVIMIGGGLCAAAGFALAVLAPALPLALAGYVLVGAGCANIVPVLFTAAGRQTVMPEHIAVPAITTLGYAGVLVGPALIGFVAHATSLSIAFLGLAGMLALAGLSGRWLRQ